MIRGVKIVSIPVRNQDVALKFYTEQMGFKVATDQHFGRGNGGLNCSFRALILRSPSLRLRVMKTGLAVFSRSPSGAMTWLQRQKLLSPKVWN
jgi:catechol 2,3-dioxygenase-like lactoylglutathione lyase family enzyme